MISKRGIAILLLFSNLFFSVLAKENIRVEKGGLLQRARESIINFIAKKKKYDTKGWVDILTIDQAFNKIDIRVHNEKIICNSGNSIVEVHVKEQTLIEQTDDAIYGNVKFGHNELSKNSNFINPLPVMRSNQYYNGADSQNVLPSGFEGYIVCEKKNSNAILMPQVFESVEFIAPPWSVRVSVELFKNPCVRYGRQFRITILDNVNILMNNQNSFTWSVPFESFADVYDFHLAVRDSKNGRFCILGRDESFDISLKCDSWKKSYGLKQINTYFIGGFIGMNLIQGIAFPLTRHKKVPYYTIGEEYDSYRVMLEENKNVPEGAEVKVDDKGYKKDLSNKGRIALISNLVYLGIAAITNGIYGLVKFIQIKNNLDKFNKELEEAQLFYPYKLQYPEMYISAKNDVSDDNSSYGSLEAVDENYEDEEEPKSREEKDEELLEDIELNPTIMEEVEEIVQGPQSEEQNDQ